MATNGKPLFVRTSARSGRLNQSDAHKKTLHYTTLHDRTKSHVETIAYFVKHGLKMEYYF